jgi:hypothetical protein
MAGPSADLSPMALNVVNMFLLIHLWYYHLSWLLHTQISFYHSFSRRRPAQRNYVCSDAENQLIHNMWSSQILDATAGGVRELLERVSDL